MTNSLLSTQALQDNLIGIIPDAKNIVVISAYITDSAIDWILKKAQNNPTFLVIARLSPQDMAGGASTFKAIKALLNAKHEVRLLGDLHAKIYLIDKVHLFVGSANLTNNGLKLFGNGNIETSIKVEVTKDSLDFIDNICKNSTEINFDILKKMEDFVKNMSTNGRHFVLPYWGDDIVKPSLDLWTVDMLQEKIIDGKITNKADKVLLFGVDGHRFKGNASSAFKKTKIYRWLIVELNKEKSKCISFGMLSEKLHNAIIDDPSPYRKTIKQYAKVLLSYCKNFALDQIEVIRPNYSEIIKLKE